MNNEKILEEILENTKTVKKVVVDKVEEAEKKKKEKAEKAKTAKQKAEAKFKMVGTKLNEQELTELNIELERLGLNQSQYFKKLIKGEIEIDNDKKIKQEELLKGYSVRVDTLENEIVERRKEIDELEIKNNNLKAQINSLEAQKHQIQSELDKEITKSFFERLRALF